MNTDELGACTEFDVVRIKDGNRIEEKHLIATEVPCTIEINGKEAATIMATPTYLKEFAVGYLFTAGVIHSADDVKEFYCDKTKWRLDIQTKHDVDLEMLGKRVYTSGCGKGVMYSSMIQLSSRHAIETDFTIGHPALSNCMKWLLTSSSLYRETHGVHSAALSLNGDIPDVLIDDIGRHNAVDKVIGYGLVRNVDFSHSLILSTGRISSEILHKAKRSGIPVVLSRGAPTHQTVLLARDMGVTVIGFARGGSFTIYTHSDRVV